MVYPFEADKDKQESTDFSKSSTNNELILASSPRSNEQETIEFADAGVQTETSITDGLSSSKSGSEPEISADPALSEPSSSVVERIQVDAVHPFLEGYHRNRRKSVGSSTREDQLNLYYCSPCRTFMIASLKILVEHFNKNYHEPINFCVYCRGPVYVYVHGDNQKLYHKCDNDELDIACDSSSGTNNNNNNILIDIDEVQKIS